MVVQHNLTAMNSNRMLGLTQSSQAKSTEKLSSGYKINRAADDAAGLSISEKMRKQIRGLTQASANAEDGISTVQTAEGALNEVQDMLQRMNELAVKASNGTNSENDRTYIQNEIDQLTTEIDRVAETTKFNETYLLKGDKDAVKGYSYTYGKATAENAAICGKLNTTATGSNTGLRVKVETDGTASAEASKLQNELLKALQKSGARITVAAGATSTANAAISVDGYDIDADGKVSKDGKATNIKLTLTGTASNTSTVAKSDTVTLDSGAVTTAAKTDRVAYYDKDGNKISENALANYFTANAAGTNGTKLKDATLYDEFRNKITTIGNTDVTATKDQVGSLKLSLHVGADATSNNKIELNLDAMSAKGLGVNGIRVDGATSDNADAAIETIKEAIQKVSTQRSALGAVQNRLEHTISNLDNVVENTTSAESAIRDTDMATEMVKYSNNNILSQAGQAMLAQANQSNQGVLSLLQ
ncbi:flagellin [Waltera sp.]|uniref:flagellin N-terminal helical domain-containing protein n=1 Tax=Waltera sp. TaxID=2815806 RepID=UPI003AEFB4C2